MGGVRAASVVVNCDRCKKDVMVTDDDQANGYRDFAKASADDPDERMFVAILNVPGGEPVDVDMQFVCPKCCDAISTYMDKVLMKKPPKKGKEEEDGEEKPKKKRKSKAKKTEEEEKAEDEQTEEPAVEPENEEPEATEAEETEDPADEPENQGEEFEDDELFD